MFQEVLGEDKVLDLYANPFENADNQQLIDSFYDETLNLSPYRAICGGHIDFLTDRKLFQGRKPLFVSVVREPLERFVSYYNYICMADEDHRDMLGRFPSSHPSLVEMALSCKDIEEFYFRLLEDGDPTWSTSSVQTMFLTGTKEDSVGMVANCLDTGYHAVAPLPMIGRLFDRIAAENGVSLASPPLENVSVKRISVDDITPDFRELYRKRASIDYFTYYYVFTKSLNEAAREAEREFSSLSESHRELIAEKQSLEVQQERLEEEAAAHVESNKRLDEAVITLVERDKRLEQEVATLEENIERLEEELERLHQRRWLFNGWPSSRQ